MKNTIPNFKLRLEAGNGNVLEACFAYSLPVVFYFGGKNA